MDAKTLVAKLSKFYWSPNRPETYVLRGANGRVKGIGNIAHHDYGAFNLAWADVQGKWQSLDHQTAFVEKFAYWRTMTGDVVDNYPLREWVTLYSPQEFEGFLAGADIKPKSKLLLGQVTEKALAMEIPHGVP